MKRALISVYDKSHLDVLALGLAQAGVTIVSTGSTASHLAELGVDVVAVSEVTGFPEGFDGRVKTLHPAIHAGVLADRRNPEHVRQLAELAIDAFDLVVVNLYPFEATVSSGAEFSEVIEQIDIGGPALVRAAAKNHANVAVVVDPADYDQVVQAAAAGGFQHDQRLALAAKAFAHTAAYDAAVANWFGQRTTSAGQWPTFRGQALSLAETLRYGENPHQQAALYRDIAAGGLANATLLHGKPMSYNNYVDADSARLAAYDFSEPAVAIIKHTNPCGIAIARTIAEAHSKAFATDPTSAYGGVVAANRPVDATMAHQIAEVFTEVVVAPEFTDEALEILSAKKNLRLLRAEDRHDGELVSRAISGGSLVQTSDLLNGPGDDPQNWRLVAGEPLADVDLADLVFAWRAVKAVKSNAILLASDGAAVGVGMGQVNRVDSAKLAVARAGNRAAGSFAASDAFFPFPDGLQVLIDAGVRAVVQPGGSVRDAEVIAAAREAGIAMYLTATRHFLH